MLSIIKIFSFHFSSEISLHLSHTKWFWQSNNSDFTIIRTEQATNKRPYNIYVSWHFTSKTAPLISIIWNTNIHYENNHQVTFWLWILSCAQHITITSIKLWKKLLIWAASSEFGTYRLCEKRRFRQACASAHSHQNLRFSLLQAVSQEEPSDSKPDPWPLWMAGHAQLTFVMAECSKTQIRLTRHICATI